MQVTYGDITLDFATLPDSSRLAMLKRGVSHFFGNEIASKVSTRKKAAADKGEPMSEADADALHAQFTADAIKALNEGTVGVSTRGPAADPVDVAAESIARAEVSDVLKANGAKFTGKGDERRVKFADGSEFTMDQLIERRLANPAHAERIRKAAEKVVADKAKKLAKAKVEGNLLDAI